MYDDPKITLVINLFQVSCSSLLPFHTCLLNLKCATVDDIGQEKGMPLYIEHQEKLINMLPKKKKKLINIGNDTFF